VNPQPTPSLLTLGDRAKKENTYKRGDPWETTLKERITAYGPTSKGFGINFFL
jgi:hypothetical protein